MSEGMPALCPERFDVNIWEKVKDKEMDSSFLLILASELKKLELLCNSVNSLIRPQKTAHNSFLEKHILKVYYGCVNAFILGRRVY